MEKRGAIYSDRPPMVFVNDMSVPIVCASSDCFLGLTMAIQDRTECFDVHAIWRDVEESSSFGAAVLQLARCPLRTATSGARGPLPSG